MWIELQPKKGLAPLKPTDFYGPPPAPLRCCCSIRYAYIAQSPACNTLDRSQEETSSCCDTYSFYPRQFGFEGYNTSAHTSTSTTTGSTWLTPSCPNRANTHRWTPTCRPRPGDEVGQVPGHAHLQRRVELPARRLQRPLRNLLGKPHLHQRLGHRRIRSLLWLLLLLLQLRRSGRGWDTAAAANRRRCWRRCRRWRWWRGTRWWGRRLELEDGQGAARGDAERYHAIAVGTGDLSGWKPRLQLNPAGGGVYDSAAARVYSLVDGLAE